MAYRVDLSRHAMDFLAENVESTRMLDLVQTRLSILSDFPRLGAVYDPTYPAAKPPVACRHYPLSDTPFTAFYVVDDEARTVSILSVEWSSGDPKKRFTGYY